MCLTEGLFMCSFVVVVVVVVVVSVSVSVVCLFVCWVVGLW